MKNVISIKKKKIKTQKNIKPWFVWVKRISYEALKTQNQN